MPGVLAWFSQVYGHQSIAAKVTVLGNGFAETTCMPTNKSNRKMNIGTEADLEYVIVMIVKRLTL
jgi:hypothetical protein